MNFVGFVVKWPVNVVKINKLNLGLDGHAVILRDEEVYPPVLYKDDLRV